MTKDVYDRPARRSLDSVQQAPGQAKAVVRTEASHQGTSLVVGQRSSDPSQEVLKVLEHLDGSLRAVRKPAERDEFLYCWLHAERVSPRISKPRFESLGADVRHWQLLAEAV